MESQVWIAVMIGIVSTVQVHLAKALERQGIEIFDQLRELIQKTGQKTARGVRKPFIYTLGLLLNNTIFLYAIIAQRYAPPAVYTSMFGFGLVFLMVYSIRVLHENVTRMQVIGSIAIIAGSVTIGVESILRGEYDRSGMALSPTIFSILIILILGVVALFLARRSRNRDIIALVFGIFCGVSGSLDPFLKGVSLNLSGLPLWIPASGIGMAIFITSFILGFIAFAITQVGFALKSPASRLVPAYNTAYITLPVILQAILLPGYNFFISTYFALGSIILGIILMRDFRSGKPHPSASIEASNGS